MKIKTILITKENNSINSNSIDSMRRLPQIKNLNETNIASQKSNKFKGANRYENTFKYERNC